MNIHKPRAQRAVGIRSRMSSFCVRGMGDKQPYSSKRGWRVWRLCNASSKASHLVCRSGYGELVTPPKPRSLSKDSIRPRQRGRKQARVKIDPHHEEPRWSIDRGAVMESSTTPTHPSLGQSYTSLPDDSSDADADSDPLQSDSTDLNPNSLG